MVLDDVWGLLFCGERLAYPGNGIRDYDGAGSAGRADGCVARASILLYWVAAFRVHRFLRLRDVRAVFHYLECQYARGNVLVRRARTGQLVVCGSGHHLWAFL